MTKEEMQIFMRYPNALVKTPDGNKAACGYYSHPNYYIGFKKGKSDRVYYPMKFCKLILKDLSDISDEDLEGALKAAGEWKEGVNYEYTTQAKKAWATAALSGDPLIGYKMADFLRSQGYNLGDVPEDMYINAKEVSNG